MMCYVQHSMPFGPCKKDDGKDYTFDSLCGLLIKAQEKLLDEGKLEVKQERRRLLLLQEIGTYGEVGR
jgi:hypothetical protein